MQSRSEQDGLNAMTDNDLSVLSVGISTGGEAEMKMLEAVPGRHVTATTLDQQGIEHVRTTVPQALSSRLELRNENIADPNLDYSDAQFDFVYARLVLHYLSEADLDVALQNIRRILKPDGKLFVVVRSTDSPELKDGTVSYDEVTKLTTYKAPSGRVATRYFHTVESISDALERNGFAIGELNVFDEDLSPGFVRDTEVRIPNNLIEVLARKR